MEAIVLAGGLGTRLHSVIRDLPKPMADIHGRPFLAFLLDHLADHGVSRVLLSVGYRHEVIERHFGSKFRDMQVEYVVEHEPLGTGGGLRDALGVCRDDAVFVMNGDTYFAADLRGMITFHRDRNADMTIALKALPATERYGTVLVAEDGRITGFREKVHAASGYVNGGTYVVDRRIAGLLASLPKSFSFEHDFLEARVHALNAYAFVSDAFFVDIGVPEDYAYARDAMPRAARERMSS